MGNTISCWIQDCPAAFSVNDKTERKGAFLRMLDHVYDHMHSEGVDFMELRRDDRDAVMYSWKDIVAAYRSGSGVPRGELELLHRHYIPWGVDPQHWSLSGELGEDVQAKEDPGKRKELLAHDQRHEKRELERRAREAKGKGKAVDRCGSSSGHGAGVRKCLREDMQPY